MYIVVLLTLGLKGLGDSLYSKSKYCHYHYELLFLMSLIFLLPLQQMLTYLSSVAKSIFPNS